MESFPFYFLASESTSSHVQFAKKVHLAQVSRSYNNFDLAKTESQVEVKTSQIMLVLIHFGTSELRLDLAFHDVIQNSEIPEAGFLNT